jgi:hypothetical protein
MNYYGSITCPTSIVEKQQYGFTCKVKHCGICHNGAWGRLENNSRLDILIFE